MVFKCPFHSESLKETKGHDSSGEGGMRFIPIFVRKRRLFLPPRISTCNRNADTGNAVNKTTTCSSQRRSEQTVPLLPTQSSRVRSISSQIITKQHSSRVLFLGRLPTDYSHTASCLSACTRCQLPYRIQLQNRSISHSASLASLSSLDP